MNALPGSPAIEAVKRRFSSAYELIYGREPEATFPTPLVPREMPWRATIDYIFVPAATGGQGKVAGAWLAFAQPADRDPSLYASDHYGLIAEIAFVKDAGG